MNKGSVFSTSYNLGKLLLLLLWRNSGLLLELAGSAHSNIGCCWLAFTWEKSVT